MDQLSKQLKDLYNYIPGPGNPVLLRERIMKRIALKQETNNKGVLFYTLIHRSMREMQQQLIPLVVSVFVFVVLALGAVIFLATGARPGDTLYSVKLRVEQLSLAVPLIKEEVKVDTEIKYAKKRQNEIIEIIGSNASMEDKSRKIHEAGNELTRTIASTQKRVEKISKQQSKVITAGVASTVKESIGNIKQSLDKATNNINNGGAKAIKQEIERIYVAASVAELSSLELMIGAASDTEDRGAKPNSQKEETETKTGGIVLNEPKETTSLPSSQEETNKETTVVKNDIDGVVREDEKQVKDNDVLKGQIKEDLYAAIEELKSQVAQLESSVEEKEGDTGDEKEDGTSEVTFSVEEAILREQQKQTIAKIEETIQLAESAMGAGNFKGALEFIKTAQGLLEGL